MMQHGRGSGGQLFPHPLGVCFALGSASPSMTAAVVGAARNERDLTALLPAHEVCGTLDDVDD